jgi:hypothetical protein
MEIVTQQLGEALEVKVKGRLDNYWTEHLRGNLEEVIRGGAHGIRLNLSEISFLSSAAEDFRDEVIQLHRTTHDGLLGQAIATTIACLGADLGAQGPGDVRAAHSMAAGFETSYPRRFNKAAA